MHLPSFEDYLTESPTAHQDRGICQICGREQAVRDKGNITHHGYTIKYGWFQGACPGQRHKPLQHDKSETERQIKLIEEEIPKIEKTIAGLKSGRLHPLKVKTDRSERVNGKFQAIEVDWKDANEYYRKQAVEIALMGEERRVRAGKDTITFLHNLIATIHGKDLRKVERVEKKKMEVGSVVNIAGHKSVTITKIEEKRAQGVGPYLNGQYLPHAYWTGSDGRERSYPLKLARWPK